MKKTPIDAPAVEIIVKLNWLERLRALCGRPLRVRAYAKYSGATASLTVSEVRIEVAPVGGDFLTP